MKKILFLTTLIPLSFIAMDDPKIIETKKKENLSIVSNDLESVLQSPHHHLKQQYNANQATLSLIDQTIQQITKQKAPIQLQKEDESITTDNRRYTLTDVQGIEALFDELVEDEKTKEFEEKYHRRNTIANSEEIESWKKMEKEKTNKQTQIKKPEFISNIKKSRKSDTLHKVWRKIKHKSKQ